MQVPHSLELSCPESKEPPLQVRCRQSLDQTRATETTLELVSGSLQLVSRDSLFQLLPKGSTLNRLKKVYVPALLKTSIQKAKFGTL